MRKPINLLLMVLLVISAQSMLGNQLLYVTNNQQNDTQSASQDQQTPQDSQGRAASSAAAKSVTGCVIQSDNGYALKTESDTYPIDTEQDLAQYVNKQVTITAVAEHHRTAVPSTPTTGTPATVTDLRLRTIVSVTGDCPSK